jgi:tetratricopeptide (TPR) repeat protein
MNEAMIRYQKLLEQHPNNELARFSLGKILFDLGQLAEAKAQFELALARKPDWMLVHILLGKCESSLGNREPAKAAFERARRLALEQKHDGPLAEVEQLIEELSH